MRRWHTAPPGALLGAMASRRGSWLRWVVLVLSALLILGSYYVYDNPSALHNQLKRRFEGADGLSFELGFNLFYTTYSLPNLALPLLGGLLTDKIGVRRSLLLFAVVVAVGQLVFALGVAWRSMGWALCGRFVFGLGGESLSVASNALVSAWFAGRELALALGVNLSFSRLGSVANDVISPWLAERDGVTVSLLFGFVVCVLSVVSSLVLAFVDSGSCSAAPADAAPAAELTPRSSGNGVAPQSQTQPTFVVSSTASARPGLHAPEMGKLLATPKLGRRLAPPVRSPRPTSPPITSPSTAAERLKHLQARVCRPTAVAGRAAARCSPGPAHPPPAVARLGGAAELRALLAGLLPAVCSLHAGVRGHLPVQ